MARFLLLFLFALSLPVQADYLNTPPSINTTGSMDIGGIGAQVLSIKRADGPGEFRGDGFDLTYQHDQNKLTYHFVASYGRFTVYVAQLAGTIEPQIVLVRSEGRGTSASSFFLDILDVDDGKVVKKYQKRIAGFFGDGEMWWYSLQFEKIENAYLFDEIRLQLTHDSASHGSVEDLSLIPKQQKITIYMDQVKKKYLEKDGWDEE